MCNFHLGCRPKGEGYLRGMHINRGRSSPGGILRAPLSPGLSVRQFAFTSGWVGPWYDYVSVVSKLNEHISLMCGLKIRRLDDERRRTEDGALNYTSENVRKVGNTVHKFGATWMSAEKVIDPILNDFWQSKTFYLLHKCCMSDRVECFGEVKGKHTDIGCMVNMVKTLWRRVMRAASVEPVGRNANWSAKWRPIGGCWSAG